LRIALSRYAHSKRHRKVLKGIDKFQTIFRPLEITPAHEALFYEHKQRFTENIPENVFVFVGTAEQRPLPTWECAIYDGNTLIASSFIDIGENSISSIYGMFSPAYASYSLGIATMLLEMNHAKSLGKAFYYHGYCYDVPSHYDYKKQFDALEGYDWQGNWLDFSVLMQRLHTA
jgi:arginine-tRNA-protein transferase